ncbi:hypothetical protein OMAG_002319 [Candidatus Omnitrophus magneticus]|uniref:Uncharacterized protein n=1 Tax=Candidatus Omnitrophus magneticus TaxID=1609969 RepID=A0A0F0CQM9_9BACT|nr:hypothetical protein OMAG_002319 [Candidatus Omnitrophus magneticus]
METRKEMFLVRLGKFVWVKVVAVIVAGLFLYQDIVWAGGEEVLSKAFSPQAAGLGAPLAQVERANRNIDIPYNMATKGEVFSGKDDRMIFHIQDAHASLSAQYSIVELLDNLSQNYNLDLIALEGASGYIDTSILKTFPDEKIKKGTAEYLMKEGRLGATEFFSVTREKNIPLYGIENNELYQKNVQDFCVVVETRAKKLEMIDKLLGQLKSLEEKIYSEELAGFNKTAWDHKEKKITFSKYWENVHSFISKYNVDITKYIEVTRLIGLIEDEKRIDFNKANTERQELVAVLNAKMNKTDLEELVKKSVEFKEEKISASGFHLYLAILAHLPLFETQVGYFTGF